MKQSAPICISYKPVRPSKLLSQEMAARGSRNLKCFESKAVFPSGHIFLVYVHNPVEPTGEFAPQLTISVLQVIDYKPQAIAPTQVMIDDALRVVGWNGPHAITIGENKVAIITRRESYRP